MLPLFRHIKGAGGQRYLSRTRMPDLFRSALPLILCLAAVPDLEAQTVRAPFQCLLEPQSSEPTIPEPYVRSALSNGACVTASDVNGSIDAGWPAAPSPADPSRPMTPEEQATVVTECFRHKGVMEFLPGRGEAFQAGELSPADLAALFCECNQRITTRKLTCFAGRSRNPGAPHPLSEEELFLLAHGQAKRCVALLMVSLDGQGHMVQVTGGSLNDSGEYELSIQDPNRPGSAVSMGLRGRLGGTDLTFNPAGLAWARDSNGRHRLREPGAEGPASAAYTLGYVLKCPRPSVDAAVMVPATTDRTVSSSGGASSTTRTVS